MFYMEYRFNISFNIHMNSPRNLMTDFIFLEIQNASIFMKNIKNCVDLTTLARLTY